MVLRQSQREWSFDSTVKSISEASKIFKSNLREMESKSPSFLLLSNKTSLTLEETHLAQQIRNRALSNIQKMKPSLMRDSGQSSIKDLSDLDVLKYTLLEEPKSILGRIASAKNNHTTTTGALDKLAGWSLVAFGAANLAGIRSHLDPLEFDPHTYGAIAAVDFAFLGGHAIVSLSDVYNYQKLLPVILSDNTLADSEKRERIIAIVGRKVSKKVPGMTAVFLDAYNGKEKELSETDKLAVLKSIRNTIIVELEKIKIRETNGGVLYNNGVQIITDAVKMAKELNVDSFLKLMTKLLRQKKSNPSEEEVK